MPSVWEQPTAAPAQHIAGPKHLARRGFEGGGAHYRRRTGWIIAIVPVSYTHLPKPADLRGGHFSFVYPSEYGITADAEIFADFFHGVPAFDI